MKWFNSITMLRMEKVLISRVRNHLLNILFLRPEVNTTKVVF